MYIYIYVCIYLSIYRSIYLYIYMCVYVYMYHINHVNHVNDINDIMERCLFTSNYPYMQARASTPTPEFMSYAAPTKSRAQRWSACKSISLYTLQPINLVGGWATPLKNMSSSIGMMTFPIHGKIKNGNQTTNQLTEEYDFVSSGFPWLSAEASSAIARQITMWDLEKA